MTYELAKQLKDAGFPQNKRLDSEWSNDGTKYPSLSELIEACSQNIFVLTKQSQWHGGGWIAGAGTEMPKELSMKEMDRIYHEGKGQSPEEVVARLWLELNKSNAK